MWVSNSSISTQLHLQLPTRWLVPKTLTFPKLPFPIARKISKWSKVTARKSNISILNDWANLWQYYVISTFSPYELRKMRDTPEMFCSFWRFGCCLNLACLTVFFLYGSAAKASSLGQPLSVADQAGNHRVNALILPSCTACGEIGITLLLLRPNAKLGPSDPSIMWGYYCHCLCRRDGTA